MGFTDKETIKDRLAIEFDKNCKEIEGQPYSAISRVAGHMQLDDGRFVEVSVCFELDPEEWSDEEFADSKGLI